MRSPAVVTMLYGAFMPPIDFRFVKAVVNTVRSASQNTTRPGVRDLASRISRALPARSPTVGFT